MSFLGRLFATDKAIDNITDKDDGLLVRAGGWVGAVKRLKTPNQRPIKKPLTWKGFKVLILKNFLVGTAGFEPATTIPPSLLRQ